MLGKELEKIKASKFVIQIDVPESQIRNDGLPYSKARPIFQGVIIAFNSKFGHLKYLTDSFDDWRENLRAIALGLEALRKVDRYGITKRGEQYKGWKQLPAAANISDINKAAEFISSHSGISVDGILRSRDHAVVAYRRAARKLHPDKGGDKELFNRLQKAKGLLLK